MVDMYAESRPDPGHLSRRRQPVALCPCFDRAGYIRRDCADFPFRLVVGGLVSRFLFDRKEDGVYLHKVPLVRWQAGLHYASSTHTLFPVPMAEESGVLMHFKFMADFIDRAKIESERKQYWQGAKRYTEFSRRFAADAAVDFRCELTERFRSTGQLVELGLMRTSSCPRRARQTLEPTRPCRAGQAWRCDVTEAPVSLAVVVPTCNARHLLARSLASVAAQSGQPAQVLVLDQGSADGVDDWLRLRWPSVELRSVRASTGLDEALGAVSAAAIAFLEPGDICPGTIWPRWATAGPRQAGDRLTAPALRLTALPTAHFAAAEPAASLRHCRRSASARQRFEAR